VSFGIENEDRPREMRAAGNGGMGFIVRMIRFVIWVLILSWGIRLFGRLVAWMLGGGSSVPARREPVADTESASADSPGRRLVRDPICGVHVAEVLSIPLREGTESLHFCSVACRDAYVSQTRKLAANG
jgi:hypothetical protein